MTKRLPVRLQLHASECGTVCLGMLLEYHGAFHSNLELRQLCSVSRDGATIAQIQRGAQQLGYNCKVSKRGISALANLNMPVIIHWDMHHYVVLESLSGQRAIIHDPAVGRRKISLETLDRSYTGISIEVETDNAAQPDQHKPPVTVSFWELLRSQKLRKDFKEILLTSCSLFSAECIFWGSIYGFFDSAVEFEIKTAGFLLPLLCLLSSTTAFVLRLRLSDRRYRLILGIESSTRAAVTTRLLPHLSRSLQSLYPEELFDRINAFTLYMQNLTALSVGVVTNILIALPALGLLFWKSTPLFILTILPGLFAALSQWHSASSVKEQAVQLSRLQGEMDQFMTVRLRQFIGLYAMGMQQGLVESAIPLLMANLKQDFEHQQLLFRWQPILLTLEKIHPGLITFTGLYLLLIDHLSFGELIFLSLMSISVTTRIKECYRSAQLFFASSNMVTTMEELSDLLEEPADTRKRTPYKHDSDFAVQAIRMGYGHDNLTPTLFSDVNLEISKQESVCIVGNSGVGKTTLLEIISGQKKVVAGEILLFGRPVEEVIRPGYVFADDHYLQETMAQHFGMKGQSKKERARLQGCLTIVELDQRLQHYLREPENPYFEKETLSRGELERLCIARAFWFNPEILLIDEAFSHVSSSQARRIIERLRAAACTLILVSHRSEIQELCDRTIPLSC
ncbi:cysteine peptidase family C39 domain-containing protein [Desulfogranum mediterraneum]|uniref:cysteine peptidase family C39 domain-containing protein n=1 Tax=Desulfogranum mediterraneum TaxID=160661 RepID=UPI0004197653|nr:cysteine peptidase family C39 domain-containing protein [Desulfogranum mediterraneum]